MSKIICLSGKARSGKDTVCSILRLSSSWRNSEYFRLRYPNEKDFICQALKLHSKVGYSASTYINVSFASLLKGMLTFLFNVADIESFNDEIFKNSPNNLDIKDIDGHVLTYRELLQKFGTEIGRQIDPELWIKATFNYMRPDLDYIITDARFKNEVEACASKGAVTIRINREVPDMPHESEHDLDDYDKFTHVIDNNGTIEELVDKVISLNLT